MTNVAQVVRQTEKHTLIGIRQNEFDTELTIGYVRHTAKTSKLESGDTFPIPAGWRIISKSDENDEILQTKNGEPLSFFTWKPE